MVVNSNEKPRWSVVVPVTAAAVAGLIAFFSVINYFSRVVSYAEEAHRFVENCGPKLAQIERNEEQLKSLQAVPTDIAVMKTQIGTINENIKDIKKALEELAKDARNRPNNSPSQPNR